MIPRNACTELDASAEAVFAALTGLDGWSAWMPLYGFPDGIPESVAQGQQFQQTLTLFGFKDTVATTITENQAPKRFALHVKGTYGADVDFAFHVEPLTEDRSRLHIEFDVNGRVPRPLAMLVKRGPIIS